MFGTVFAVGLVLMLLYYKIISIIKEKLRATNELASSSTGIKACVIVAVSFFVCWIPQSVVELSMQLRKPIPFEFQNAAYFIMLTNPCLNPLCYAYYRRDFRRELRKWFKRRWREMMGIWPCFNETRIQRGHWKKRSTVRRNGIYDIEDDGEMQTIAGLGSRNSSVKTQTSLLDYNERVTSF